MYAWIIDKDHVGSDVGVRGPKRSNDTLNAALSNGEGKPFRMYDDDGELYYEGRLVISKGDKDPEVEFRPLTDFGMPNAGATEIHYCDESGNWKRV
jgi:hypothetical protein